MKVILSLLTAFLIFSAPAFAGALSDGQAAYESEDYKAALKLLLPLADQGDASAQAYLGWMYQYGQGVKQDKAEAFKWLAKSAEQGIATAQAALGGMYANGEGVVKDPVQAYKWASIAQNSDNADELTSQATR